MANGFEKEARHLSGAVRDLIEKSGFREFYNPFNGKGYGAEGLGMSCLIVDWMARLGIVEVHKA